ncbi:EamA domain-containing membrane protein RarD [Allokutzneria albata]|uniref:EamA domain-containing membrane protein RarD n=1 Tax=Allokutzneria albata TaxID=211114 RepID=A0A1G9X665_ALLAB|nr:EamA domain-containing membrane protein RarD [Allokutzneria albata]
MAGNRQLFVGGACERWHVTTSAASSIGSSATAHRTPGWLPWAALGVVYLVWGSTYLGIRFTITSMPPLLSAGLRFLLAGLLLAVIVLVVSGRPAMRMSARELGTAALGGLLLPALGNGIVVIAQFQVASGLAALLVACVPLYVVVLRRISGERPPWITFAGIALGLAGLAVLLLGGSSSAGTHGSAWWGPWLVLLAAMFWAAGSFATTKLPVPANPFVLSAVQMVVGGTVLSVAGLASGERVDLGAISASSWIAWGYLVVFGSVLAFSSYVYALGKLPVSTVATYAYVNPVIAVVLGVLLAGERFDLVQLAGGALVLVAVVLVVRAERRSRRAVITESSPVEGTVSG